VGDLGESVVVVWSEAHGPGIVLQAALVGPTGTVVRAEPWPEAVPLGMVSLQGTPVLVVGEGRPLGAVDVVLASPIRNPDEPIFRWEPTFLEEMAHRSIVLTGALVDSTDDASRALVAWWRAPRTLHFVLLDDARTAPLIEELDSPASRPFSPALVNQARRELRKR
jgi:hypothetical protein